MTTQPAAYSWTDEETVAANAAGRLVPAQQPLMTGAPARIMSAVGRIVEMPGAEPEVRAGAVRIEVHDGAAPLPPPPRTGCTGWHRRRGRRGRARCCCRRSRSTPDSWESKGTPSPKRWDACPPGADGAVAHS